ncbi:NDR1/HIN1-like protein 3 [Typha angustifolia]|uniref:NDR1/HIN1-like protein 3 n=1 Tax=Typha angustifolia TaxID=59011 RepID=UPI003C2BD608
MPRHDSSCGMRCLLYTLFKYILSFAVFSAVVAVVLWLIFRPDDIKASVDAASLTIFTLSSTTANNLNYNLTLDMSIRNPNKRTSIYFEYVEAQALYAGSRFGFTTLPPFYQEHKTTKPIHPVFQGSQLVAGGSVVTTYERELGEGYFYIDVKLYTKLRLKAWIIKRNRLKSKIHCTLKLPVPGSSNAAFEGTKCDVDF